MRAKQRRRPCQISQWLQIVQCFRGTTFIRSASIFSASVCFVRRSRCDKPRDVGIDDDAFVFSERVPENDVRCLAANARQRVQRFHRVRHAAAMLFLDRRGSSANALGLVAKEAGRADRLLKL